MMPSKRRHAGGKPVPVVNLLDMLDGESDDVATIFRTVIQMHLSHNDQDNPRERQSRIQRMIQDCVEKDSCQNRGEP